MRSLISLLCVFAGVSFIYAQSQLSTLAESMHIRVKMVDNLQHNEHSHTVRIYIKNIGNESIPSSGWRLYFHSMYILYPGVFPTNMSVYLEVEKVQVGMIQGDLYYLEPSIAFVEIQPGEERDYDIKGAWWSVARTDFMPYWYIASDKPGVEPVVVKSTSSLDLEFVEPFNDVRQWKRYAADRYNPYTPQERFSRLSVQDKGKIGKPILPTPNDQKEGLTTIDVDGSWKIYLGDDYFNSSKEYLAELLSLETALVHGPKTIALLRDSGLPHEAYRLRIYPSNSSILLESNDTTGMFYAVQSLRSIADGYQKVKIPELVIEDAPRYHYRGMHIDVARNFHSVDDIKRLMKVMAMYKMNKLHLHLSDDEGWRLEVPDIPELTQVTPSPIVHYRSQEENAWIDRFFRRKMGTVVGSKRCHDILERSCIIPQFGSGPFNSTSGSGFYSTEEYKDLLSFATRNHIQVIPEFDMPGHAHAAIAAMEERYRRYHEAGNETEASKYRLKDPDDTSEYISVQQWLDNALNPCLNSTYALIGKVMDTLIELHKDIQPLEIYNFGGDEVASGAWEQSPICQTFIHNNPKYNATKGLKMYFVERVAALAADRNLALAGWEDGFADGHHDPIDRKSLPVSNVYAIAWNNIWEWGGGSQAYKLANAGYKVIIAPATNLYFDQPQEPDPEERGLYWATRFTDTRKVLKFMPDSLYDNIFEERSGKPITKQDICSADMSKCTKLENVENVIGIQGQLWSETVRSSQNVDYMIYPRLLALAERAWHKAEFETVPDEDKDERFKTEWENFANTLGYKELLRLDKMKVQYRVPPPGARVNLDGSVEVSPTYPGLQTQVSFDDGNSWTNVSTTIMFRNGQSHIHLRSLSADRTRFSRPVLLEKEEMLDWTDQHIIDYIAENLVVRLNVIDNLNKVYTQDGQQFIRMRLELQNKGSNNIVCGTWRIYFYSLYGARTEHLDCGLKVEHENGALYYLTPSNRTFIGISPGNTIVCNYLNMYWMVSRTDSMPNWYVTSLGMQPKTIQHTTSESLDYVGKFDTPAKWKRQKTDQYDPFTPAVLYDMYKTSLSTVRKPYKIVPTPSNMTLDDSASFTFTFNDWVVLSSSEFGSEAKYLAEKLTSRVVSTKPARNYVQFKRGSLEDTGSEAYTLNIESTHITITAEKAAGAFYGAQSLVSLVEGNGGQLVKITINDKPRYPYRGVMLDTARNFKPKQLILQFLDVMAIYKLNKLHLHLSDDEAWRITIPGVPELSQIASQRCHTDYDGVCVQPALGSGPNSDNSGSGFYSVQDYKDILTYANKYHIEIIPEIDVPGHSYAAIAAMNFREKQIEKLKRHGSTDVPESFLLSNFSGEKILSVQTWWNNALDPCLNSTYRFIEVVIDAFVQMHKDIQPLNVFHVGGDEVASGAWNNSAACIAMFGSGKQTDTKQLQRYFTKRVADIVASRGLNLASWDDGLYADNKPDNISYYKSREVHAYTWDNREVNIKRPAEFANEGYKVVLPLATHLYFDQAQGPDPDERGLYWATRYTDTEKTFGLLPDDLYANVDVDRMGNPISLNKICNDKPCPTVNKTENILGLEACMWAETMRTRDQFHYMAFPRLLALAERAWHKAPWESLTDKDQRNSKRKENWKEFSDNLAFKEFRRLEKYNVSYRIPPPGARVEGGVLKANTKYANLEIQWRQNANQKWDTFVETKLSPGSHTYWLRAKSKTSDVMSREVEISTNIVSASEKSASSTSFILIMLLSLFLCDC